MASSQLTEDDVLFILAEVRKGKRGVQSRLAIEFDVTQQTISEIATGKSWSSLTGVTYVRRPHAKISKDTVLQVDAAIRAGMPVQEITARFNLPAGTVSQIKNGKRWAGVTGRPNRRPYT
jgi:hypothetical protein